MKCLLFFFFLQYYEMSYGLNIEMHKQVSFIQSQAKTTNESWFFNTGFLLWGWGVRLYTIFLPWFPFLQTGGSILQQGLLLDSYTIFK